MRRYSHGGRRRELTIGRDPDIGLADKQKAEATAAKDWTVRELAKDDRTKKLARLAHSTQASHGRHLRRVERKLFERPVLRFGATFVQLPWVVGTQDNSTAAINNLRRLGSRRTEARDETQQIETRLADLLRGRGFRVVTNWNPPADAKEAGEVDVIAARDGHLFVLEIKSACVRQSQRDAWVHGTSTLRQAGRQIGRKPAAVRSALEVDCSLVEALGGAAHEPLIGVRGWIVDTSIECDHQRFSGFLKISLEEVLIALLDDPEGSLSARSRKVAERQPRAAQHRERLDPSAFTAARFIEVIEEQLVWASG